MTGISLPGKEAGLKLEEGGLHILDPQNEQIQWFDAIGTFHKASMKRMP